MQEYSTYGIQGLTEKEVLESRLQFGSNEITTQNKDVFRVVKDIVKEPMVVLLLVAALLYFISGETGDAIFMTFAIIAVMGISLFQESRSRNSLAALKTLTAPTCRVIRNGKIIDITREEIVIGDYMMIEEGTSIPADGVIIHSNDFSINESILTGESLPVNKDKTHINNHVFQGTTVTRGLAICRVDAIGVNTELGRIGKSLESIKEEKTPLQKQISNFVKKMAIAGIVIFLIVWAINFFQSRLFLESLLQSLTLAMSILPEEIPVAFATFMALGAWRLMKKGVIVKETRTVEALGSATVICTDKTGTITQNRMSLAGLFVIAPDRLSNAEQWGAEEKKLIEAAMWASEPIPFDPMETALHDAYLKTAITDKRNEFTMIHEYPLEGRPPMMTHVFENGAGERIIAAKGAPEAMMSVSNLTDEEKAKTTRALQMLTTEGFRVLGVGISTFTGNDFPDKQQKLPFRFLGLVSFYDPPKENIRNVFESFYRAGIDVKIITGDNAATTATIARQIDFRGADKIINGEELLKLDKNELKKKVEEVNIFTRMFPDAKLKILNALKANGQIVAMTGDGVNDGPALKAAHIGIAMGKKGTEIAKEVSSLIIIDDDLSKMVDAVAMGRKIYANLKKAIQYIISTHIPIILTVFVPLVAGWIYPNIFSPVHVIFLELIMGPTCSIIYENEPLEKNVMDEKPRPVTTTFFSLNELGTSIMQGLVITFGVLFIYQYAVQHSFGESATRTMVFLTLISANIFLTLVNRSFYYSIFATLRYKNSYVAIIILITITLTAGVMIIPLFTQLFEFARISFYQLVVSVVVGCISVIWFEGVKLIKRNKG